MSRLRALDGLRAVSILFVLCDHLLINHLVPQGGPWWRMDIGRVGVRVFFVISGFLITGLLLREREREGRIHLRRFFFRRILRIAPPALAYLAVIAGLHVAGFSDAGPRSWFHALTYTSNYVEMPWDLSHTWSLAVEEQFYVFWPVVLAVFGLVGGRWAVGLCLVGAPIFRAVASTSADWPYFYLFGFEANADALAAGCGVALLRDAAWARPGWRAFLTGRAFWPAALGLALLWPLTAQLPPRDVWGISAANVLVALVIERCLRVPGERTTAFLDWPALQRLGVLSYAVYLCQQPLLASTRSFPLALRLVAIGAAAFCLHRFVELPALRWRTRLERRLFPVERRSKGVRPLSGAAH